jgi:type VI secretion system protein ImpA
MSLRETLLQPVSGPNRVGEYLRYEPIYDRIKDARREDLDLPQGALQQAVKKADWQLVVRLSTETLAKQSKDLQLAVWLTEALLRRDGFGGLRDGLDLIAGLIEEYWDDLHPELEDGDPELRAVPLQWLGQTLGDAVRAVPLNLGGHSWVDFGQMAGVPSEAETQKDKEKQAIRKQAIDAGRVTPEDFEAEFQATSKAWYKALVADLAGSLAALEALDRLADERFGSEAPSFRKLRDALQEVQPAAAQLLARKLEAEPDPVEVVVLMAPEEIAEGVVKNVALAGGAAAVPSAPAAAMPRSLDEASARVAAAARYLRTQSPSDPAPYLLLRGYRWGELRRTPGAVDSRLLEAPPTELRSRLKTFVLDEQWPEVLEAGEEIMAAPYGRGWLDLQRYAIVACDALRGEYEALGTALRRALRALLEDLPDLPTLTLLDDSPTANPDTQRWLRAESLLASGPARVDDVDVQTLPMLAGRHDPFPRAARLARQGEFHRAVELLLQEAAREVSERGRFIRRTQAAGIMVEAGLEGVALPILQEIVGRIETHQLERWEDGQTIGLPLDLFYRCIARHNPDDSSLGELYLRICRLDPIRAIRLQGEAQNDGSGG